MSRVSFFLLALALISFVVGGNATTKEECSIGELIDKATVKGSVPWTEILNKQDIYESLEAAQSQKERRRMFNLAHVVDNAFIQRFEAVRKKCIARKN